MNNVLQFPENVENAHFDQFLKDHNDDPELPILVYHHLCDVLGKNHYEIASLSSTTYLNMEGAVNGLLDRAMNNGVITNENRLINRRVQRV